MSGTFSDQISVHFGSVSQNVLKPDIKTGQSLVPFGANLTEFGAIYDIISGLMQSPEGQRVWTVYTGSLEVFCTFNHQCRYI